MSKVNKCTNTNVYLWMPFMFDRHFLQLTIRFCSDCPRVIATKQVSELVRLYQKLGGTDGSVTHSQNRLTTTTTQNNTVYYNGAQGTRSILHICRLHSTLKKYSLIH